MIEDDCGRPRNCNRADIWLGFSEPAKVIMVYRGLGESSVITKGGEIPAVWQYILIAYQVQTVNEARNAKNRRGSLGT